MPRAYNARNLGLDDLVDGEIIDLDMNQLVQYNPAQAGYSDLWWRGAAAAAKRGYAVYNAVAPYATPFVSDYFNPSSPPPPLIAAAPTPNVVAIPTGPPLLDRFRSKYNSAAASAKAALGLADRAVSRAAHAVHSSYAHRSSRSEYMKAYRQSTLSTFI